MSLNKHLICLTVILSSLLSGCGFHLRGYSDNALPPSFSTLNLQCANTQAWQLCQTLRQQLMLNGISFDNKAEYRLSVSPIEQETRVLSLQDNAAAAEYGLASSVSYQLTKQSTEELVAQQKIVVRNSYRHESSALLAKERERDELQTELSQQIASEIFRQIDVINKQSAQDK